MCFPLSSARRLFRSTVMVHFSHVSRTTVLDQSIYHHQIKLTPVSTRRFKQNHRTYMATYLPSRWLLLPDSPVTLTITNIHNQYSFTADVLAEDLETDGSNSSDHSHLVDADRVTVQLNHLGSSDRAADHRSCGWAM